MACNAWKLAPVCIAVCLAVKIYSVTASEGFLNLTVSCPGPADVIIPDNHNNLVNFNISANLRSDGNEIAIWFDRVCLKGNITKYNTSQNLPSYHNSIVVDPGTVCLFEGGYASIEPTKIVTVHESCGVPALQSTGKARLNLTCFDSMATVEVVTPDGDATLNHTDVLGRCITPEDCLDDEFMIIKCIRYLAPGSSSISDLPDNTICTFYGSYQLQTSEVVDFEPIQCIVNHPPPPIIPTITEDVTSTEDVTTTTTAATTTERTLTISTTEITNTNATSNESATSSTSTKGRVSSFNLAVLISFMVVLTIGITLALMAAVCLARRWYHCKMRREQKKQLHIWDLNSEETLDQDPHILPQFPHAPDSISIKTEIDCLYKEEERNLLIKSINTDEKAIDSPKLMDRFLNGCHRRVRESSHESLSNVPHEQSSSKLTELHGATYDNTCPISSISKLASDSCDVVAQHYTLNTNQQHKLDDDVTDDNHMREFTPSSVPTENYFTDDEGYLRFTDETAL